jgi:hypothetical protein
MTNIKFKQQNHKREACYFYASLMVYSWININENDRPGGTIKT